MHQKNKDNWVGFLGYQKYMVEKSFDWIKLKLDIRSKQLEGCGIFYLNRKKYEILLLYSPFNGYRYDRISIQNHYIKYNPHNHMYKDNTLCLYHPIKDRVSMEVIPLYKMIPWISEWIVFYEQWKKYGVWLGPEIKH